MILICFDGSDDAQSAIEYGGRLLGGAVAIVLTVWEPFSELVTHMSIGITPVVPVQVDLGQMDRSTEERAEALAREGAELAQAAGFDARPRARAQVGTVAGVILDEAEELDASAILMGSRGLTGMRSLVIGSVSNAVIHHADRPVLVVPSPKVAAQRKRHLAD